MYTKSILSIGIRLKWQEWRKQQIVIKTGIDDGQKKVFEEVINILHGYMHMIYRYTPIRLYLYLLII